MKYDLLMFISSDLFYNSSLLNTESMDVSHSNNTDDRVFQAVNEKKIKLEDHSMDYQGRVVLWGPKAENMMEPFSKKSYS